MPENQKHFDVSKDPNTANVVCRANPVPEPPTRIDILTGKSVPTEPVVRLKFDNMYAAATFVNIGLQGSLHLHEPVTADELAGSGTATTGPNAQYDVFLTHGEVHEADEYDGGPVFGLVREFGQQPPANHASLASFVLRSLASMHSMPE